VGLAAGLRLFALLGPIGCGGGAPEGTPGVVLGPARSFVLLTLDTTRPDHLSPYGAADAETPSLQALGEAGAVFEHAYAVTPVTLPSHATLLTGLDPPDHGVRNNGTHFLPETIPTLATVLQERGFTTAAFVSAAVLESRYGLARGFGVYDDDLSAGKPKELRMIAERPAEVTVDAALAWLDAGTRDEDVGTGSDPRFFLWVHLFDPHAAYEPPSPWAERFADRPYDGEIAYMDAQIGRLLAHPRTADPRTLVMAVADHGESLGEHGEASHAMLVYDATLAVPWIVRGPGVRPGIRLDPPVSQIDLFPTVLELLGVAGVTAELALPGRSVAPELEGGAGERTNREPAARDLYAETFVPFYTYGWAKLRSLRRAGWKYIDAPAPELYHVAEDPKELENLFAREPERAAALAGRLAEIVAAEDEDDARAASRRPLDRESREKLRSLGYLAGGGTAAADRPNAERPDPKQHIDLHLAMDRAEHHLYRREFERAVGELRRVLARDRTNRAALVDLAKALGEMGRHEEAAQAARRALALHPDDPDLHLTLAGLETARGHTEAALRELDAALALEPRSVDARVEKARVLLQLAPAGGASRAGRGGESGTAEGRTEAVALLEEVLGEAPDHGRANVAWATAVELERGDLAAAESRLRGVTSREPFLAEGWRALGRVLEQAGRTREAEAAYRDGLEYQPRDAGLHALLGLSLAERGEIEAATSHLEAASDLSPSPRPDVHEGRAAVAVARGDWPRAEAEARRAVELEPGRASAWNHLAVALEEQGRSDEALAAYERAREAEATYWQAVFNQGLLLRKLGRTQQAIAAFQEVLRQSPGHAASHYELGVLHGARGEAGLAREHLEAALEADPDHPRVARIRRLLAALGR